MSDAQELREALGAVARILEQMEGLADDQQQLIAKLILEHGSLISLIERMVPHMPPYVRQETVETIKDGRAWLDEILEIPKEGERVLASVKQFREEQLHA